MFYFALDYASEERWASDGSWLGKQALIHPFLLFLLFDYKAKVLESWNCVF